MEKARSYENVSEVITEIETLHDAFKRELGRPSIAAFRRMRKLTSHLQKAYKEFRKLSPKSREELEAFRESWKGGEK